ncbi:MAG: hypothetical protein C4303_08775 [candidate division GAL15 bacterium]
MAGWRRALDLAGTAGGHLWSVRRVVRRVGNYQLVGCGIQPEVVHNKAELRGRRWEGTTWV